VLTSLASGKLDIEDIGEFCSENSNPDGPELARFVHERFNTCDKLHSICGSCGEKPLPKRVLSVGTHGTDPFLYEPKSDERGRYVCLSHCWGFPSYTLKTTLDNLAGHLNAVEFAMMPLTFQQAVAFTRKLNVDYLWIDSLCIIQDDAAEWETESLKMASIYESSLLTLVATESSDSRGGLFATVCQNDGSMISIQSTLDNGKSCTVYTRQTDGKGLRWRP
jgi:hypothetical protein